MGIDRGTAKFLLKQMKDLPFEGSVLQLGKQDIYFDLPQLQAWAEEIGTKLDLSETVQMVWNKTKHAKVLSALSFFKLLGFKKVFSCDYSKYEKPDFVVDLNRPVSLEHHGTFDMILDGGTLEHVFHLPQALANIHTMLKMGGRIIHCAPTSNYVEHGFYMFSPTFFWDYYSANQYQIRDCRLYESISGNLIRRQGHWRVYKYMPGAFDSFQVGGWDNPMGTLFCGQKMEDSRDNEIPQQGFFSKIIWAKNQAPQIQEISPEKIDASIAESRPPLLNRIGRNVLGDKRWMILKDLKKSSYFYRRKLISKLECEIF